jgi:hypothetical protein
MWATCQQTSGTALRALPWLNLLIASEFIPDEPDPHHRTRLCRGITRLAHYILWDDPRMPSYTEACRLPVMEVPSPFRLRLLCCENRSLPEGVRSENINGTESSLGLDLPIHTLSGVFQGMNEM